MDGLSLGHSGDANELEAEQAANRIGAASVPTPDRPSGGRSHAGNQLPVDVREEFESRFGADFGSVRVHTDDRAARLADRLEARAFTVNRDVAFGPDEFSPHTLQGKRLLAHELAHVVQQTGSYGERRSSPPVIQREPKSLGTKTLPQGKDANPKRDKPGAHANDYKNISMHFNGEDLVVTGDGKEIFRYSAQSGRPIRLTAKDAAECGGDVVTDSYLNDPRFVGITDNGPIPEGTYRFDPPAIQRFSLGEEFGLIVAGVFGKKQTTVQGQPIHAGDWGSGRVALQPVGPLKEGPCGHANSRSGFFLHGGWLAGSSGCIDIGTNFNELADFLTGYKRPVTVKVSYERRTAPPVGFFTGLSGLLAYGKPQFGHGPQLSLGAEFTPTGARAVGSIGYNAVMQWAGGALSLGARLDIPFNDREAFVRAGLSGALHFRLLRGLYGQLSGGYNWDLTGREMRQGAEFGAGLKYDFGRTQLEVLYNVLRPMAEDQRIHQALVGVGFVF